MADDSTKQLSVEVQPSYDVVVVGAGPAGASAAKALSNSGLKVVILEKCSARRDKMCSGVILPSARKFLAENYGDVPQHVFTSPDKVLGSRCVFTSDSQRRVVATPSLDLGENTPNSEYGLNVERLEFDYWLCEQAQTPVVDHCFFVGYTQDENRINLRVRHAGKYRTIKTRVVIGADGPASRVRRSVAPEFESTLNWVSVYEEQYDAEVDLEPGWMYWMLDSAGFGSLLLKDGKIHVDASTARPGTAKKLLNKFVQFLTEQYGWKHRKTLLTRGILMNDLPFRKSYLPGAGNVLLAGEAGGFVRALDGITSALVTGKAAGEAALESFESGKAAIKHYQDHAALHSEWAICKQVQPPMFARGFTVG